MFASTLLKLIPIIALAGCVETMQQVNRDLAAFNKAIAPAPASMRNNSTSSGGPGVPNLAPITAEQLAKINAALTVKNQNRDIAQAISEATPVIRDFVRIASCLPTSGGSNGLNAYAAPGADLAWGGAAPMPAMRYHDKSSCVTVLRVHGWKMPARNALHFEVVYQAEDSGESAIRQHELVKQPSNEWLFSR